MKLQSRILIIVLACLAAISCTHNLQNGKRIVFIGDSITDGNWGCIYNYKRTSAERSHTDMNHIYGHSYVYIIASYCQSRWPSRNYAFFNRGFSGQALVDLAARWQEDVIDLQPDILTVLIGTNDIHRWLDGDRQTPFDFAAWKAMYKSLLEKTKQSNPDIELTLCTPFVAKEGSVGSSEDYALREEMVRRLAACVRELCEETGAILIPYDTMFEKLVSTEPAPSYWIWDGIHPTPAGHKRMADLWLKKAKS